MNILNKFNFWKKFSHYFIILFSAVFLFAFSQQMVVSGAFLRQGPDQVLAEGQDCLDPNQDGCTEPGGGGELPPIGQPAAPAAPAAPAPNCTPVFQYNECIACNTSRPVYTDSCTGAFSTGSNQSDSQCASWCAVPPAPPAVSPAVPAGGSTCTPNDQITTKRDCVGTQMCTFNKWVGSDCSTGWGGAYNCQNDTACGFAPPAPVVSQQCVPNQFDAGRCRRCASDGNFWGSDGSDFGSSNGSQEWCFCAQKHNQSAYNQHCQSAPPALPKQPTAPSCPNDIKQCPNGSIVHRNAGLGCNFDACPVQPTQPAQPTESRPACPGPGQSGTRLLCNQWAYDNCSVAERDSNGNVTRYHCVWSGNDNCIGDIPCQATTTTSCTPTITQESSCVGNQLCSFNNNRASDCTTSRTGPFSCQLIAGQCGFNPGSTCTVATAQQSLCVNTQLCTVNVTTNSNCTISRSGSFNCQNSTQCGFSTPPAVGGPSAPVNITNTNNNTNTNTVTVSNPPATFVARSFGNVGVGQSVYTQGVQYTTTLPKTGLPALAWIAGAFLPAGLGFKKFGKVKRLMENHPSYIWEDRQFKSN